VKLAPLDLIDIVLSCAPIGVFIVSFQFPSADMASPFPIFISRKEALLALPGAVKIALKIQCPILPVSSGSAGAVAPLAHQGPGICKRTSATTASSAAEMAKPDLSAGADPWS
jgi:hypothetical protein